MRRLLLCAALALPTLGDAQPAPSARPPVRMVVARLTHGHVNRVWSRPRPDIEVVGIYEPDTALAGRLSRRFGFPRSLVHADLARLLDATKPEAVLAFGSIAEHRGVVEIAAPRGIHVMVEKPLAFTADDARRIAALAARHRIHVLTNYETTWYASAPATEAMVRGDSVIGPIRKLVIHDGHPGPKEIGVGPEFLAWLSDPAQNGGGAIVDFGCYGANLATWLMKGAAPTSVTAVTQRIKPHIYPKVDDEATIVLTYPGAQAIIQASWNWPVSRKDLEVYGATGYVMAPNATTLRVRRGSRSPEESITVPPRESPFQDEFQYFAAVVRGEVRVSETDLSSLTNNVLVARILDAARRSARIGRTVKF